MYLPFVINAIMKHSPRKKEGIWCIAKRKLLAIAIITYLTVRCSLQGTISSYKLLLELPHTAVLWYGKSLKYCDITV